jgi:hypothetical protein
MISLVVTLVNAKGQMRDMFLAKYDPASKREMKKVILLVYVNIL